MKQFLNKFKPAKKTEITGETELTINNKVKDSPVFNIINISLLVVISLICFLPFLNVISVALSSAGFDINFTPQGVTGFNFKHHCLTLLLCLAFSAVTFLHVVIRFLVS